MTDYAGGLGADLFGYPGGKDPIFGSLDLKLKPGDVLVVTGNNSMENDLHKITPRIIRTDTGTDTGRRSGYTTDGQWWWRKQIIYLPQEPSLINATIAENLLVNCPKQRETLKDAVDAAGLRRFVDESENGLETPVVDNGWRLSRDPPSHGMARGLISGGKLVLFDEPIESFDAEGIATVHAILSEMAKQEKPSLSCRMIRRL